MSKIKNRLLQLIEIRGISKREFCRQIDVSHTYLNGDSEIGSDKLEVIISVFPELSLEWLITGEGAMFSEVNAPQPSRSDASAFIDYLKEKDAKIEELLKELTKYKTLYEQHPNENVGSGFRVASRAADE